MSVIDLRRRLDRVESISRSRAYDGLTRDELIASIQANLNSVVAADGDRDAALASLERMRPGSRAFLLGLYAEGDLV